MLMGLNVPFNLIEISHFGLFFCLQRIEGYEGYKTWENDGVTKIYRQLAIRILYSV